MSRPALLVMFLAAVLTLSQTSAAAPPHFENVEVSGIELLPQSILGAALFVFDVEGQIDGRRRSGWGWIAVNHEELPEEGDSPSAITGGDGAIWVGLRRYDVDITGGTLTLKTTHPDTPAFDDLFDVTIDATICRRPVWWAPPECAAHTFTGELDHVTFPPTIVGILD